MATRNPSRYALLVGIDAYPSPQNTLSGAVRDVEMMAKFLQDKDKSIVLYQLIAKSDQTASGVTPNTEYRRASPSHANVWNALNEITSLARPGDFVYFHFSGHGTAKSVPNKAKALALILLSGEQPPKHAIRYLWGREIAGAISRMVEKRIHLTITLDCCHSGSLMRSDCWVRYLPYDSEVGDAYAVDEDLCRASFDSIVPNTSRSGSLLPQWLTNAEDCSIMTACGPTETARELEVEDTRLRHGAFSYYLLQAFKLADRMDTRLDIIYNYVQAMFREDERRQVPMLLGDRDYGILGRAIEQPGSRMIATMRTNEQNIHLPIGVAQGVCIGDRFRLRPLQSEANTVVAQVTEVTCLRSRLVTLNKESSYIRVRTGWMAKAVCRLAVRQFRIRMSPTGPELTKLIGLLTASGFTVNDENEGPFMQAILTGENALEITDCSDRPIPFPFELRLTNLTAEEIYERIEHLLWYKWTRDIVKNQPNDMFRASYSIQVIANDRSFQSGPSAIEVKHEENISFVAENKGDYDLFLFIYGMGRLWDVYCALKRSHLVVTAGSCKARRIKMTVNDGPHGETLSQSDDVFKVFITSHWTSFNCLILPELRENGDRIENEKRDINVDSGSRSLSSDAWDVMDFHVRTTR